MKPSTLLEAKDIQCPTHAYLKTSGGSRDDSTTMTDDIEFCHCGNSDDTRRVPEDGWTIETGGQPVDGQVCCELPENAQWFSNKPWRITSTTAPSKKGCENQWSCDPGYRKKNDEEACEACPAEEKPDHAHWLS